MTKEDRHDLILETLLKHEQMQVIDLASLLDVSLVTIRKDLTTLEKEGRLYRSHGKAILINPYINNRSVNEKESLMVTEKRLIGQYCSSLVTSDDTIIIASGTTVTAFARCINPNNRLTVITSSLPVSESLVGTELIDVFQLGGFLRHSSCSVVGKYAEDAFKNFSCSKLFLGVDGIDLDFGLTTTNLREAELNRVMMAAAQKTVVLADSTKFRRRGFCKICNMEEVDLIVTDSKIPDKIARSIEALGIELVVVKENSI